MEHVGHERVENGAVECAALSHLVGLFASRFLPYYHRIEAASPSSCEHARRFIRVVALIM